MAIEKHIYEFSDALKLACNKSFKTQRASKKATTQINSLVDGRANNTAKRTNAVRRIYQRTRNNDELREKCKTQYFESEAKYAATVKKENVDHGRSTAT
jgi:hypothetical protein